ncbi:MAG: response regulator [Deltaproteobacteria bacterium]|nr:response regulator [Deltaproteobacteria bacterium]
MINHRAREILLVDDNPSDVRLTLEAFKDTKLANNVSVAGDGVEAMEYLRQVGKYAGVAKPDLVLLDLNMPRKDGREVLEEVKNDPDLRTIPILVLTTSKAEADVLKSYDLHVNCYMQKPVDYNEFVRMLRLIEDFWFTAVVLPPNGRVQ